MAIIVPIVSTWNPVGLEKAVMDISKADGALAKTASFGKSATNAGKKLTMGLTVPIALLGAAAVKSAAQFDESMAVIKNMGLDGFSMKAVEDEVRKMGRETVYSSQEAADAFITLQKAGQKTADIMGGGLAASMNLAATEGMNMADAAEIMSNTMNTFNLKGKDAGKITDIIAAGAMASSASVEDLAFSLKYVSGSAATLKVPLEDTVAAIAMLSNAGLKGSTAGTSLNNVLMAMASPTKAAKKQMDELGLSYKNAKGEMKPIGDIFTEMGQKMEAAGMSRPEKLAALKELFNIRGARAAAVLAVMDKTGQKFKDMRAAVDETGVAADMQRARVESFAGTLEKTAGAAKDALISLGQALQPVIEWVGRLIQMFATWFSGLPKGVQTAIAMFLLFAAAIGPVLIFVGMLAGALSALVALITGPVGIAIATTVAAFGWWIVVIIAVVAAVIAAVVLIVKNWDKIKAYFANLFADWKQRFPAVFAFIGGVIKIFVALVKATFENMVRIYKFAFEAIWNIVKTVMDIILKIIGNITGILMTIWETFFRVLLALFRGDFSDIADIVKDGAKKILGYMNELPQQILKALGDLGSLLYNKGKELMQGLLDGIKSVVSQIKNAVKGAVGLSPSVTSNGASGVGYSASALTRSGERALVGGGSSGGVVININGDRDPYTTARIVKRAIEGYDVSQGRAPGRALAKAW